MIQSKACRYKLTEKKVISLTLIPVHLGRAGKLNIAPIKFVLFLITPYFKIKHFHMTDTEKDLPVKKVTKKEIRKQVYEKLAGALAEYKTGINEKKFDNRLKKVSKVFALDIAKAVKNGKQRNKKEDRTED